MRDRSPASRHILIAAFAVASIGWIAAPAAANMQSSPAALPIDRAAGTLPIERAHCRAVWHTHRRCVRWSRSRCVAFRTWRHRC